MFVFESQYFPCNKVSLIYILMYKWKISIVVWESFLAWLNGFDSSDVPITMLKNLFISVAIFLYQKLNQCYLNLLVPVICVLGSGRHKNILQTTLLLACFMNTKQMQGQMYN